MEVIAVMGNAPPATSPGAAKDDGRASPRRRWGWDRLLWDRILYEILRGVVFVVVFTVWIFAGFGPLIQNCVGGRCGTGEAGLLAAGAFAFLLMVVLMVRSWRRRRT